MTTQYSGDTPLINFTNPDGSLQLAWTATQSWEHVAIFGSTGAGKTSSTARMLALKYLANSYGGLVLTAKKEEKDLWIEYCKMTNRVDDLVIIEPCGNHFFNFLDYVSTDKSNSKSYTDNVLQILKTSLQASEEKKSGKSDDPFWENALEKLLYTALELAVLAYGSVSVQQLYEIIISLPNEGDESKLDSTIPGSYAHAIETAKTNIQHQVNQFMRSLPEDTRKEITSPAAMERMVLEAVPDGRRMKFVHQFFKQEYLNLSEKTKSIVSFSCSSFLFQFLREPVYSLFCCKPTNITPEACYEGKIVLINLPVQEYEKLGQDCQVLVKNVFQRAFEKRDIQLNGRPLFLWADEAQKFFHPNDAEFLALSRSSRVSVVYITQNLPSYYSFMGSAKYKEKVDVLLGNFNTKFFHANSCMETNKYASELFGSEEMTDISYNKSISTTFSQGQTESKKLKPRVRPEEFTTLKNGGPGNGYLVEAYIYVQSKAFANGLNFRKVTLSQKWMPSV